MKIKMGETCFTLDSSIATKEPLFDFFKDLGFELIKEPSFDEPNFSRAATFTNNDGLTFDVVWFRNLAHIRIGEWGKAFFEKLVYQDNRLIYPKLRPRNG